MKPINMVKWWFGETLPFTKSHAPFIMWPDDITWYNKNATSPLPQGPLPSIWAQYWFKLRGSHLLSHMSPRLGRHILSHGKIKTLYFHFYKTFNHHNWQNLGLGLEAPTHMNLDHVVTQSYLINKKRFIFLSTRPINTKPGRLLT